MIPLVIKPYCAAIGTIPVALISAHRPTEYRLGVRLTVVPMQKSSFYCGIATDCRSKGRFSLSDWLWSILRGGLFIIGCAPERYQKGSRHLRPCRIIQETNRLDQADIAHCCYCCYGCCNDSPPFFQKIISEYQPHEHLLRNTTRS